jgi:hypothetical protein
MFPEEFPIGAYAAHGYNHAVDSTAKSRAGGHWRFWAALVAVWALAELGGARSWPDRIAGMHLPDQYEEFMRYAAQETNAASLCEKIPWSVYLPAGWDAAASYQRSDCYETIAGNTKDPWLCLYVKRLGSPAIIRAQTSMWSCLARARRNEHSGMAVRDGTLLHYFAQMGYSPDTIQNEGVIGPLIRVKDLYRGLSDRYGLQIGRNASGTATMVVPGTLSKDELMRRIERVIGGRDAPLPADEVSEEDAAYLADLGAMTSKDAGWCGKIPPGLPLTGEPEGFRSVCLYQVAVETKNEALCDRIPVPAGMRVPQASRQATCRFEIESKAPRTTHYAAAVPQSEDDAARLLQLLKVEIPTAQSLPENEIAQSYWQFLFELGHAHTVQEVGARQRFIARAESLKDDKFR